MSIEIYFAVKAEQTRQTHKGVVDMVVVFKMILQTPLVFERTKALVTKGLMAFGVVNVVLQTIAVLEYANAEVTVVIVGRCLFDMVL